MNKNNTPKGLFLWTRTICLFFHTFKKEKMIVIDKKESMYKCPKCGCDWIVYY